MLGACVTRTQCLCLRKQDPDGIGTITISTVRWTNQVKDWVRNSSGLRRQGALLEGYNSCWVTRAEVMSVVELRARPHVTIRSWFLCGQDTGGRGNDPGRRLCIAVETVGPFVWLRIVTSVTAGSVHVGSVLSLSAQGTSFPPRHSAATPAYQPCAAGCAKLHPPSSPLQRKHATSNYLDKCSADEKNNFHSISTCHTMSYTSGCEPTLQRPSHFSSP